MAKRQTSKAGKKSTTRMTKETAKTQQARTGQPTAKKTKDKQDKSTKQQPVTISHEQIEERAKTIWRERGFPTGEDVKNWLDAESQLKQELGVH